MQRYKLIVEYDGAGFVGWQSQENGPSIQDAIEKAARSFCGEEVRAFAAGRTDAGVHAIAMTAHMDFARQTDGDVVRDALNHFLQPAPIAILAVSAVDSEFHARFSAVARSYRYLINTRRAPLALNAGRAWRIARVLDVAAMHDAAQRLVGKHDFSTFRAAPCQAASPVKTLNEIAVTSAEPSVPEPAGGMVQISVTAPSFLHHQVRSIAGSLVEVGLGKWTNEDFQRVLDAKDRAQCGPVAPAHGLYFERAHYDANLRNSNAT